MNIFTLDIDTVKSSRYHVNRHVVKMMLEYAQLLSGAVRLSGIDAGYKLTHQNHPCAIWVRESLANWIYLRQLAYHLNDEWVYRYGHKNGTKSASIQMIESLPLPNIKDVGLTTFAKATSDSTRNIFQSPIDTYRLYYKHDKAPLAQWGKRNTPGWWVEMSSLKYYEYLYANCRDKTFAARFILQDSLLKCGKTLDYEKFNKAENYVIYSDGDVRYVINAEDYKTIFIGETRKHIEFFEEAKIC